MAAVFIQNARYVLTMDPDRAIIKDGGILIEGDRIVRVGKSSEVAGTAPPGAKVIDARDRLVMPGLVNTHVHLTQLHDRGCTTGFFAPTYVAKIHHLENVQDREAAYYSVLCQCLEALKTGTTIVVDPGGYAIEEMVSAIETLGIRALLSRSLTDLGTEVQETTEDAVRAGKDFLDRYQGAAGGRIRIGLSLRGDRMVSDELARRVSRMAQEYGVGIQSHMAACQAFVDKHKETFHGLTPVERFHRIGLLGPNLLLTHCNILTEREAGLLRDHEVKIARCPTSELILAMGMLHGRHVEMHRDGVCQSLGSGGAGASNFHDMFRVMYTLIVHRDYHLDATLFSPEEILEICVTNGVRALQWEDDLGSLESGKKADMILLDLIRPEWTPLLNPVANLVMGATGASVDTVIIDGRILVEGGRVLTVDEEDVLALTQETGSRAAEKAGLLANGRLRWPVR
ncbi:MAG: amidohydrolase family protein [Firmicutes bacterium]|nr:amidohydrolase family protein [Bacillota bacterium]